MLEISESDAKNWFETNGISSSSWASFDEFQQEMLALEALASNWDDIITMRESGIPESYVLMYFYPEDIGLDVQELENRQDKTAYVVQETISDNVSELFDSESVSVFGTDVEYNNDDEMLLRIGCEANERIFC